MDKLSVLWFPSLTCHLCGLQAKEYFACSIHAWSGGMLLIYWNANNKNNINNQKIKIDLFSFTGLSITEFEDSRMAWNGDFLSSSPELGTALADDPNDIRNHPEWTPRQEDAGQEFHMGQQLNTGLSANLHFGAFSCVSDRHWSNTIFPCFSTRVCNFWHC